MKIAFIINSLGGGGAERVLQTLCNYLVKHGHDITIILLQQKKIHYILDKKVKIVILKSSILAKGIGTIVFIPLQSLELNRMLNKLEIEHAISFLVRANLTFCFTKYFSSNRVVISERNYSKEQYIHNSIKNNIMNYLIKNLYKKADIIVPISNGIKKSLVNDYFLDLTRISTIYNPQNIDYINNYQLKKLEFIFEKNIKYFITLGRLISQKDHKTMIQAFEKVNAKEKNTKLLILGEGNLRKELEVLIKTLNLQDKVLLMGFVNNPFDYLKRSDVFVFSSQFEGFGNVLVEAMACGLPIISTDCPSGPSEILEDGRYGILTKVGEVEELSISMEKILDTKQLERYNQLSLQRAKQFDVSMIVKYYLKILNE